ncbi:MAG: endonuclease III [Myxococcaceae bacterium]
MPQETHTRRRARALEVLARLDAHLPGATIELDFRTPLELLVAVMLSAQCTDKRVNQVTPALFARYPDTAAYALASLPELESFICSCGLFRNKARNIQAAARALAERHRGQVPMGRAELEALPGVGRKTAGVVSIHLGGEAAFPVDTHVFRVARRLALARAGAPEKVEEELCALLPQATWAKGHQLFVWHGRRTCHARAPSCAGCPVEALCPKVGLSKARRSKTRAARPSRP